MARLNAKSKRPDGAGNQHFAGGGFARFSRDFHASGIEPLYFIGQAEGRQLEAIGAERIGFDDLRARFDVSLMDAKDGFRLGGIELIKATLRANRFVQQRTHRAIGNEDGILEAVVEVENFHRERS